MTTFINLPGASAKKWLWNVGAKAVSTFYGRITDSMRMDPLARLQGEVESVSGLACFSKQRYDNFHQSTRGVGQLWLWGVGAKAISTFYGRITDAMRMDPLARLHGGAEEASLGLPASQNNDMRTFINLRGASAKKWLWSVGAKAVSTFYGRITDSLRMDPLARLHGEVESISELACFSNQRYDNFHQSTRGVGQKMALGRRG
ncbi:hypothetical protein GN958_ATG02687 [Phytophthora infestans]|uniref:Uncharacterized protein n=1 Tax=Phytophthora infestans TaxID=4787 RepID=A0A8S9V9Q6_PHYIN|nr:hypothetical protein GN958_ATG02687 [Phytophthora infestans]